MASGVLSRAGSVEDGSTVCDFDEAAIRQQRSIGLALAPVPHEGVKVNLIDTPATPTSSVNCGPDCGPPIAVRDRRQRGVDEPTRALWHECDRWACRVPW